MKEDIIGWDEVVKRSGGGQQGIIFGKGKKKTRLLMSKRTGAPYVDSEMPGFGIIYEGEDVKGDLKTKAEDQQLTGGNLGLFNAAIEYLQGKRLAEPCWVFEKLSNNQWVDLGEFKLVGAEKIHSDNRYVYRFFLSSGEEEAALIKTGEYQARHISSEVRQKVWKRDGGKCVLCGSDKNLHFDHEIPFSLGGGNTEQNIRILCAKCNLKKSNKITE